MSPDRWRQIDTGEPEPRAERLALLARQDQELCREGTSRLEYDRPDDQSLQGAVCLVAAAAFQSEAVEGERLGSYRLVRKIGQGGRVTVYWPSASTTITRSKSPSNESTEHP